jgi:formylglycine-generating enzyme required for sulfatase activity
MIYVFEDYSFDIVRRELRRGNDLVAVEPQVFDLLQYLISQRDRVVSKDDLVAEVWGGRIVSDSAISSRITAVRHAVGDTGETQRLIKTFPRKGFRFVGGLREVSGAPREDDAGAESAPTARPSVPRTTVARSVQQANIPSAHRDGCDPGPRTDGGPRNAVAGKLARLPGAAQWRTLAAICTIFSTGLTIVYLLAHSTIGALLQQGRPSLHAAALPTFTPRPTFKDCEVCPEMVELPTGEFAMGSPETESGREGREGPLRRVVLAERIAIGKFEVTIDQFADFIAETGFASGDVCSAFVSSPPDWRQVKASFREPGFRVTGSHPAVCVNWHDAKAYAAWLSNKTGKAYRLPTESEWEYAVRAGTTTAYSFGKDEARLCEFARFADADSGFPWRSGCHSGTFEPGALKVGSLAPNPWGLYDVYGNAWEWVEDCWTPDARLLPSDGSAYNSPQDCTRRGSRGGGWAAAIDRTRSAYRAGTPADARFYHRGFRVAVSPGR